VQFTLTNFFIIFIVSFILPRALNRCYVTVIKCYKISVTHPLQVLIQGTVIEWLSRQALAGWEIFLAKLAPFDTCFAIVPRNKRIRVMIRVIMFHEDTIPVFVSWPTAAVA